MPATCAVAVCKSNHRHSKVKGVKIAFFKFPQKEQLRNIWIDRCNRNTPFNPNTSRVCSLHFKDEDFERDLRSELLNQTPRLILKFGSIPSQRLENPSLDQSSSINEETLEVSGDNTKLDENITSEENMDQTLLMQQKEIRQLRLENKRLKEDLLAKETQIISKHIEEINQLKLANEKLQEALQHEKEMVKHQKRRAAVLCTEKLRAQKKWEQCNEKFIHFKNKMEKVLSPAQLDLILNKKKVQWKQRDVMHAFAIRYLGRKAYIYLRDKMNYPFPSLSTLKRWRAKRIEIL